MKETDLVSLYKREGSKTNRSFTSPLSSSLLISPFTIKELCQQRASDLEFCYLVRRRETFSYLSSGESSTSRFSYHSFSFSISIIGFACSSCSWCSSLLAYFSFQLHANQPMMIFIWCILVGFWCNSYNLWSFIIFLQFPCCCFDINNVFMVELFGRENGLENLGILIQF